MFFTLFLSWVMGKNIENILKGALASKMIACAMLPTGVLLCGMKPFKQAVGIT